MTLSNSHESLFKCNEIVQLSVFFKVTICLMAKLLYWCCTVGTPGTLRCKPVTRSESHFALGKSSRPEGWPLSMYFCFVLCVFRNKCRPFLITVANCQS